MDGSSNTSIVPATFSAAGKRNDNNKKKEEWGCHLQIVMEDCTC